MPAFYKLPSFMFLSPPACLVIVCMLFIYNKPALTSQRLWNAGQAQVVGICVAENSPVPGSV